MVNALSSKRSDCTVGLSALKAINRWYFGAIVRWTPVDPSNPAEPFQSCSTAQISLKGKSWRIRLRIPFLTQAKKFTIQESDQGAPTPNPSQPLSLHTHCAHQFSHTNSMTMSCASLRLRTRKLAHQWNVQLPDTHGHAHTWTTHLNMVFGQSDGSFCATKPAPHTPPWLKSGFG
jgi:hypothetical protein